MTGDFRGNCMTGSEACGFLYLVSKATPDHQA